jgi:hypothetical protein
MRKYMFSSVLGLSVFAGSLAVAVPAHATQWHNYGNQNYLLSVRNNTTTHGQAIVIQVANGLPSQDWALGFDAGTGYYTFFSQITPPPTSFPLVMGVSGGVGHVTNGTGLIDWESNGSLDQNWSVVPAFVDSGHQCYVLVDAASPSGTTRVAGVSGGVIQQNRPVIIWDYFGDTIGHPDQFWCAY